MTAQPLPYAASRLPVAIGLWPARLRLRMAPSTGPAHGDHSSPTASPASTAEAMPRVRLLRVLIALPRRNAGPAMRCAKGGKIRASAARLNNASAIQRPTIVALTTQSLATAIRLATRVNMITIPNSMAISWRFWPRKPANSSGMTGSVQGLSRLTIPPKNAIKRNITHLTKAVGCDYCSEAITAWGGIWHVWAIGGFVRWCIRLAPGYIVVQMAG